METTPLRADEILSSVAWPSLNPVDVPLIAQNSYLVLCAGFERRSVEALKRFRDAGCENLTVVVIEYLPKYTENRKKELTAICARANYSVKICKYDRANPAGIWKALTDLTQAADRILVDISGMSRLLIVQSVVAMVSARRCPLSILYTEAMHYPPSKRDFYAKREADQPVTMTSYLSTGIIEIASTPELGSVAMLGESIRLIAFPSFDPSHLSNLVNELQPTYANIIHGLPHMSKDTWRIMAIKELNIGAIKGIQNLAEHTASTLDYRETLQILLQVYAERSMYDRFVVAPTGSKMQALAIGLFRAVLHDIQIVYPTPMTFTAPREHTVGCRELYVLDLPDEFQRLVKSERPLTST